MYRIENVTHVEPKFKYPLYEFITWMAALKVLARIRRGEELPKAERDGVIALADWLPWYKAFLPLRDTFNPENNPINPEWAIDCLKVWHALHPRGSTNADLTGLLAGRTTARPGDPPARAAVDERDAVVRVQSALGGPDRRRTILDWLLQVRRMVSNATALLTGVIRALALITLFAGSTAIA